MRDLREQACWLLLVFESGLPTRIINNILVVWCHQGKHTLQEFFAAGTQEWRNTCHLNEEMLRKLERAKEEKLTAQAFLAEQLEHDDFHLLTVLDTNYPKLLRSSLKRDQAPPILFYSGNLHLLERETIAIIGSRKAGEESLAFTHAVARCLAEHGANIISGNARGVDRAAYEGAVDANGYTTVVLPHGIRRLSGVQMRAFRQKIDAGNVLLLSQFHPDAQWVVSRAMERNKVVTGLAQIVIVAESDIKGGTWEGANGAMRQHRPLYVRQPNSASLSGNKALIEQGGYPLSWPTTNLAEMLAPLHQIGQAAYQQQLNRSAPPSQLSLLALSSE